MIKAKLKIIFSLKDWKDWFKEGLEDFSYNLIGNFLPLWALFVVKVIDHGFLWKPIYEAFHQPYTYLILSGTYLTSTFYLQSKPKMESRVLKFFYFPLLFIIGYLVSKKLALENLSAPFYLEMIVIIVFLICFVVHTFFLFRSHYIRLNLKARDFIDAEKNNLEKDFDITE